MSDLLKRTWNHTLELKHYTHTKRNKINEGKISNRAYGYDIVANHNYNLGLFDQRFFRVKNIINAQIK